MFVFWLTGVSTGYGLIRAMGFLSPCLHTNNKIISRLEGLETPSLPTDVQMRNVDVCVLIVMYLKSSHVPYVVSEIRLPGNVFLVCIIFLICFTVQLCFCRRVL